MHSRKWPCLCGPCRIADFAHCQNSGLVGSFKKTTMKKKGSRVPKSRGSGTVIRDQEGYWEVEAVVDKRYHHGLLQYQLSWKGYEERTWQYVDKLDCFELIEEFELREELKLV